MPKLQTDFPAIIATRVSKDTKIMFDRISHDNDRTPSQQLRRLIDKYIQNYVKHDKQENQVETF